MSAGTKIFLALFGAFVLLVVFYYGLWSPGGSQDDVALDVGDQQETAENTRAPGSAADSRTDSRAGMDLPRASTESNSVRTDEGGLLDAAPPAPGEGSRSIGREIEMGGAIGLDGPVAANAAMEIGDGRSTESEAAAAGVTPPETVTPPRKTVDLVPVAQYVVVEGDTLSNVASRWFGDAQKWDLIVAVNPGLDPDALQLGQTIKLPDRDAQRPSRVLASNMPALPATTETTYVVRPDDSLSTIAYAHYGKASKWAVIYEANRSKIGPDPDVLEEGMTLILPPA